MPNINITVAEKIATNVTPGVVIVCGNSDYLVTFDFDAEWGTEPNRVARFVYYKNGKSLYQEAEFTGDTVSVPILSGVDYVLVGVYAGNLRTTTPAKVLCDRSILCGNQIKQTTEVSEEEMQGYADAAAASAQEAATSAQDAATYAEAAAAFAQEAAAAATNALEEAKESGEFNGPPGEPGPPGDPGAPGAPGKDGYTPEKGMDYYTPEEKAEFEAYIASELAKRGQLKPDFAQSTDDCTDTSKLYVLPDGFIYGFVSVTETVKDYTNLANNFESGRYNSSGVVTAQSGATACTDYIGPLENGDIIRIKGYGAGTDYNSHWASANKVNSSAAKLSSTAANYSYSYDSTTGIITLQKTTTNAGYVYFRISGILTGTTDDVTITLNEEIKDKVVTTQKWVNTGHAFVPADYEDRIFDLEDDMNDAKNGILSLQNKVETMGGNSPGAVAIPSYWETMVAEKTATVKALQTAGGKNCVSFAWASDTHIPDNDGGRTTDIGKVMAKMLDNCDIPFAVLAGDINTRASCSTEEKLVNAQEQMPVHLAPLWGTDRLLVTLGNHDGCWGDSSGYYRNQFTPERMWQTFFRWQALDFRRVFSDDGLYFYIDNVAQKTRFVVLNSNFGGTYAEDGNGRAVNDRFGTSCYGQAQLDWLANVALDMPEGYGAVIVAHVPLNITYTVDKAQLIGIVNAYNNKTAYSGSYAGIEGWTSNNVSVDFTDANGEIIAMFMGHVHGDSIDTETMTCPILTILSAGASANEVYTDGAPTRIPGTDTETSFDVVTINKTTRTIYCTRVGAGYDREINY